jgi:amino acid transporter
MTFARIFFCIMLCSIMFAPPALAAGGVGGDYGLSETAKEAGLQRSEPVPVLVGNIIGSALSLIAVIFFILMVYGGFIWMTAHGSPELVKKAQDTITAAIIGLIVVLGSYAITNFVFQSVDGGGASGSQEQAGGAGGDAGGIPGASMIKVRRHVLVNRAMQTAHIIMPPASKNLVTVFQK